MGGFGSGRPASVARRETTDQVSSVDVRALYRQGPLVDGAYGFLTRGRNGPGSEGVAYRIEGERLILSYHRYRDGEKAPVEQRIAIEHTPCHYGGVRPWWRCPGCQQRVAVVYRVGKDYRCRRCQGLRYASQYESVGTRQAHKARKLRQRLGGSPVLVDFLPERPKGMHRRTYRRLYLQALAAQEASLAEVRGCIDQVERRVKRFR